MPSIARLLPFLFISALTAQDFKFHKLRERELPVIAGYHSVDRLGGIVVYGEGKLIRLSPEGIIEAVRDNPVEGSSGEIRLLEAWNPLRIWVHLKTPEGDRIYFLDSKLLNTEEPLSVDPAFSVEPILIAPGSNNYSFWILDIDHSLKLINTDKSIVEWESETIDSPDGSEFIYLKFWQNFLLLTTENGTIMVVSRLGKVLKTFKGTPIKPGVLGEDIYYLSDDILIFENLYTSLKKEVRLPYRPDRVVATDERLVLFKGKRIEVYLFEPPR